MPRNVNDEEEAPTSQSSAIPLRLVARISPLPTIPEEPEEDDEESAVSQVDTEVFVSDLASEDSDVEDTSLGEGDIFTMGPVLSPFDGITPSAIVADLIDDFDSHHTGYLPEYLPLPHDLETEAEDLHESGAVADKVLAAGNKKELVTRLINHVRNSRHYNKRLMLDVFEDN